MRYRLSMMLIKESPRFPPPEDVAEVYVREVDAQPAVVFVLHGGGQVVVPAPLRLIPQAARVAA